MSFRPIESSCPPGLLREELIQFCLALKMLTLCTSELEGCAFSSTCAVVGAKTFFSIPTSQLKLKLKTYLFDLRLTEIYWCWRMIFKSLPEGQQQWEIFWSPEDLFEGKKLCSIGGISVPAQFMCARTLSSKRMYIIHFTVTIVSKPNIGM